MDEKRLPNPFYKKFSVKMKRHPYLFGKKHFLRDVLLYAETNPGIFALTNAFVWISITIGLVNVIGSLYVMAVLVPAFFAAPIVAGIDERLKKSNWVGFVDSINEEDRKWIAKELRDYYKKPKAIRYAARLDCSHILNDRFNEYAALCVSESDQDIIDGLQYVFGQENFQATIDSMYDSAQIQSNAEQHTIENETRKLMVASL